MFLGVILSCLVYLTANQSSGDMNSFETEDGHQQGQGLVLVPAVHVTMAVENVGGHGAQGLRTRISRLGALGKLGLPLLYSQAGQQSNAFCSIDRQVYTTSSGTSAP